MTTRHCICTPAQRCSCRDLASYQIPPTPTLDGAPATSRTSFGTADPRRVWEKFARGGVDLIRVPGDHDSILRDPDVVALARALEATLSPS